MHAAAATDLWNAVEELLRMGADAGIVNSLGKVLSPSISQDFCVLIQSLWMSLSQIVHWRNNGQCSERGASALHFDRRSGVCSGRGSVSTVEELPGSGDDVAGLSFLRKDEFGVTDAQNTL